MKITLFISALFLLALTAFQFEPNSFNEKDSVKTYILSNEKSSLYWEGRWIAPDDDNGKLRTMVSHEGTVGFSKGKVKYNGSELEGDFSISMETIKNDDLEMEDGKGKLEKHLKSPDFFNVSQYPIVEVHLISLKDDQANLSLNILGVKTDTVLPIYADFSMDGKTLELRESFDIDFSEFDMRLMKPNPEKPKEGHIDPVVSFRLNALLELED